jgi:hypothetical protein
VIKKRGEKENAQRKEQEEIYVRKKAKEGRNENDK